MTKLLYLIFLALQIVVVVLCDLAGFPRFGTGVAILFGLYWLLLALATRRSRYAGRK